jgi:glycosyltransferase involved in cell wall biosynthesis
MKILLNCRLPFSLAHGGMQIQIEQTQAALLALGLDVEPLRWWDERQRGDLIHYFGAASLDHIRHAHDKGIPLVMTNLFSATCNRPTAQLRWQGRLVRTILKLPFGEGIKQQLSWRSFGLCAVNVVGLEAERRVLELVYGIAPEKVAVVPLGLDQRFLEAGPARRDGNYLICAGTITRQKNSTVLARLARAAQVPILFVGRPYSEADPCWAEFRGLLDGRWVRHQPHLTDPAAMVALLKSARGAVMMSDFENWCLTAHEAAACGLPLLLPDLNWSRERFGNQAHYFERIGYSARNVEILKSFYAATPGLPAPAIQLFSWAEAATALKQVYERVLIARG